MLIPPPALILVPKRLENEVLFRQRHVSKSLDVHFYAVAKVTKLDLKLLVASLRDRQVVKAETRLGHVDRSKPRNPLLMQRAAKFSPKYWNILAEDCRGA